MITPGGGLMLSSEAAVAAESPFVVAAIVSYGSPTIREPGDVEVGVDLVVVWDDDVLLEKRWLCTAPCRAV